MYHEKLHINYWLNFDAGTRTDGLNFFRDAGLKALRHGKVSLRNKEKQSGKAMSYLYACITVNTE